jgi:hypothetical protein
VGSGTVHVPIRLVSAKASRILSPWVTEEREHLTATGVQLGEPGAGR